MKTVHALAGGVAGAAALTLLNESAQRVFPAEAPRIDVTGMRGVERIAEAMGHTPPQGKALFGTALVGDLISNSLYFSLVGVGKPEGALLRGALLGAAAGVGAVTLPPVMGLGARATSRAPSTVALTIAWYVAGGLAAAGTVLGLSRLQKQKALARSRRLF